MSPPRKTQVPLFLLMVVTLAFSLVAPVLVPGVAAAPQVCTTPVFVNEFHYDNDGTDEGEFIEVAGPAGTDLTGWSLVLYNGSDGASYNTLALSGALPDEGGSGYGTAFVAAPGLQNGSPDGFALVDAANVVQQFLSYEGSFTAVGGPADGMTSVDVGVAEPGAIGESLQLIGTGECPEDFTWTGPVAESPGTVNAGQTFVPSTPTARVVINEFAPKGTEWVELHNAGTADQDLTGWYVTDTACGAPATTIGAVTLNPGGFFVVNAGDDGANFSLDNTGDVVILCDAAHGEVDGVGYGTLGGVPLAPFASNSVQYSAARVVDGQDSGDDAADWNLDPTPTAGSANDVAVTDLGSSLIVNELDLFPASGNDFVELYNPTGSDVDVSGWFISDGDDVAILNAGLSVPAGGWLALEETVDWTTEGTTGVDFGGTDVAYLFDTNRVRVDQLGWASGPFINECIARVPDGAGPNTGFDWTSSGGGVTLFDQPCTMGGSNYTPPVSDWVINEIHADPDAVNGDANGDGVVDTSQDEFLEIFNNTGAAVDISGWTISDAVGLRHTFPAGTVIADQCSVLVFGGGTPTGDFGFSVVQTANTGFLGLNNTGDDVILADLSATTVVSYTYGAEGGNNQSLTRDPDITGPDPLILHTTATGSGGALFSPGTQIDGTPFAGCLAVCGAPSTPVHDVQGDGLVSPLVGQQHAVEALVVADFQDVSSIRGFYIEEPDADQDANPATSEGLFVYDNNFGVDVVVGDLVRVFGTVSEYNQETQLGTISSVELCSSQPLVVTPLTVTLPFTDTTFPERFEGMAVVLPQSLTVSENYNLGRGGILTLSNSRLQQPTNVVAPGAPANALQEENNRNQIILDDGNLWQNPDPIVYPPPELTALNSVRSGDQVSEIFGVLAEGTSGWSSGGIAYRVHPYGVPTFTATNPRPVAPDPVRANGPLKVSAFNVLNYFLTLDDGVNDICGPDQNMECRGADSVSEFTRQRDKTLQALATLDADVLGLVELENTPGVEPLADLVDGLNAIAGAGTYAFVDAGTIVPGDVIKVGLIYKPAVVQPVGSHAILNSLVDPNFNTDLHRPALAQTFDEIASGGRFTVVVNHLKSKGCSGATGLDEDQGDGQSCFNHARTLAANALVSWLAGDPTGSGDPDFIIMGDLNSYAMEEPIAALEAAGYVNVETAYQGPDAYSYVYFAQAGSLDHSMASPTMFPQVTGATTWHINADEPSVLDYNEEFKSANQLTLLYNADPYRTSDHDPLLMGLTLTPAQPPNIEVDPLSLASVLEPDTVDTQTLTISNTGGADLDWIIAEEPVVVASAANGVSPAVSQPDAAAAGSRSGTPEAGTPLDYRSPADFSEGFDDITVMPGWVMDNNPDVPGLTGWFQGNATVFAAHAGAPTAYIAANFNNTGGSQISNWLLTPEIALNDGDTLSFWTRSVAGSAYPDRLQVRLSTAGSSANVGTLPGDVGDFTTLLLDINETLSVGGYPETWTQYQVVLSGVGTGTTSGRLAFRYYVPVSAGPTGNNSDYIGIDTVEYTSVMVTEPCLALADVPWLSVSPISGTLSAGGATPVDVTFDSTGLAAGDYNANLCVISTDPDPGPGNGTGLVVVPVTLTVQSPPNIFVDPLSLATIQEQGTVVVEALTISNTGTLDLDWIIDEEPTTAAPAWPAPEPVERIDSAAAMEAEIAGLEEGAPTATAPRDPAAAARAQRMLLTTGLLLVPDSTNDRVMAFDPVTGNLVDPDFVPADPDHLSTPKNAILNASGDTILVADQIDDVVQAYALDGSYIGVFAPAGGANNAILDNITGIDLKPNGNLLVSVQSGANADSVAEFDTGGNYLGNFIANGSGGLDGPFDVYPRTADWLVSSITSDQVLRYDQAGAFIASLAPIDNFPQQVTEAANGNVLIGNFGGTQEGVVELTAAGAVVGIYDPPTLGGYRGAYELPNGNILTTNGSGVHEIDRSGNLVQTKISGVSGQYIEYVEPQAAGCTSLADIPWATVDPISGTTTSGLATTVQVTFDSTGLAVGDYTGNLCIFSNDPDAGPGNETDLVVVPLRMSVTSPTAVTLAGLSATSEPAPMPVPAGLPLATLPAAAALAMAAAYAFARRQR